MPDATGDLTALDQVTVRNWFARAWKDPVVCPVCKTSGWTYGSKVVQMQRFANDAYNAAGVVFPFLPVVCNSCGHTLMFDAVKMGLVPPAHAQVPLRPMTAPTTVPNALNAFAWPKKEG